MNRKFLFFAALALLAHAPTASAQSQTGDEALPAQTLRGRVVDAVSRAPLPGAHVIVLGTTPLIGTTTDTEGRFVCPGVPLGRHDIAVRYLGYAPLVRSGVLFTSGKEVYLDVALEEQVEVGDEVVVTAQARQGEPMNDRALVSARAFSVEETRRYAGGLDDPARMVSAFAGVTTGDVQDNAIIIRGNAPKGVQWRLEGVEIPNPNHFAGGSVAGGGAVTIFSSHLLDDSDFLTGAFPAAYGNALSGVFDMRLRNGNAARREHAFQVGILGIDLGTEGPFVAGRQASYLVNYRYSTLALVGHILPTDQVTQYQDLSFKVNVPTGRFGRFALWGIGGRDASIEPEEPDSARWQYDWDRVTHELDIGIGAAGLTHDLVIGKNGYLRTTATATATVWGWDQQRLDDHLMLQDNLFVESTDVRFILGSQLDYRLGARHTNQTGFFLHRLSYGFDFLTAPEPGQPLQPFSGGDGHSTLVQAFTQSKLTLSRRLVLNAGLHAQHFALTGHTAVEPRGTLRWLFRDGQAFSVGYGLHSQIEELRLYLVKLPDGRLPNRTLGFTKSHHVVLGYDRRLGDHARLKLETYYQHLFDVPVARDSSYSLLNFVQDWTFSQALVNAGAGRNYGIDLTLERFLADGYYYLLTGSVFQSRYRGGDGIWRDSRWDRRYAVSALFGKEFALGGRNLLGLSGRMELTGGQRYSPYDLAASRAAQEVMPDPYRAFERREPATFLLDVTATYRRNHRRHSEVWALQLKNALGARSFDLDYNYRTRMVEAVREQLVLPVLSYKIEF